MISINGYKEEQKEREKRIYRRCPTVGHDIGQTTMGARSAEPPPAQGRDVDAKQRCLYVQPWGREIGTRVSEGTHFKNVLKLDDDQNLTDDSNTGVGGLKADK